jgi:hypothetical protein
VTFAPTEVVLPGSVETATLEGEQDSNKQSVPDSPTTPESTEPTSTVNEPEISLETKTRPIRTRQPTRYIKDIREGKGSATGFSTKSQSAKFPAGLQIPTTDDAANFTQLEEAGGVEEAAFGSSLAEAEGIEPQSLSEAMKRPDWPKWEEAMREELMALERMGTWELVEKPANVNVIGSKWVFRAKKNAGGEIERYKARLVAQGYSQKPGIDYFDTYAPVAKLASIRTVLAVAAREDWEIQQMDIKSAYLNGEFEDGEVIYMRQPPLHPKLGSEHLVARLLKPIYGLKQAGRRWYQKLTTILKEIGFTRCEIDHAVFYRHDAAGNAVLVIHVDDVTSAATTIAICLEIKEKLKDVLELTDLGDIHWLLGIEIKWDREEQSISLTQRSYIDAIIRRFGLEDAKAVATPMEPNAQYSRTQCPATTLEYAKMKDVPYREAIGSLMYAAIATRPDIAYAVGILSRFSDNPGLVHWEVAKRVLRYLKGTKDWWLVYGGKKGGLVGYADADGSMNEDRHAVSGYAFLIEGGAVSWSSKRQEIISLSTTEAEYVAATHASKEALWLRSFISLVFSPLVNPTILHCDNQSAIALARDHQYHARTKHIDIRFHFIRWVVEENKITLVYCPTEEMLTDTLTKALPSVKAKHFAAALGLRPA